MTTFTEKTHQKTHIGYHILKAENFNEVFKKALTICQSINEHKKCSLIFFFKELQPIIVLWNHIIIHK